MTTALQAYSPRITGAELPRNGKPIVIVSYNVKDRGNKDYQIVLQGDKPFVEIDWRRQNGTITPEMLNLLVSQDAVRPLNANNTYVLTDSNPSSYEGLRRLRWGFGDRECPYLGSYWESWYWDSVGGGLLGSAAEGGDRLKIDGIDYYIQPEVALRGKNLWEIMLYAQDNSMAHLLSPAVTTVAAFTAPEKPDEKWVRSEVERFKKNGAGLKERQVKDKYRQLRDHIWKSYTIIAGEILAWPILFEEKPSEDMMTVPRSTLAKIRQFLR